MLRGVYTEATDFDLRDKDPRFSTEQKLWIIKNSPVECRCTSDPTDLEVQLPFTEGAWGGVVVPHRTTDPPPFLFIEQINVGDATLLRHGIGSRLLKAIVRQAAEIQPDIRTIATGWCRLGLLNTLVRVFGEGSVRAKAESGVIYGAGADKSLEHLLDDFPVNPEDVWMVTSTEVDFDPSTVRDWPLPTRSNQIRQQTGASLIPLLRP